VISARYTSAALCVNPEARSQGLFSHRPRFDKRPVACQHHCFCRIHWFWTARRRNLIETNCHTVCSG